MGKVQFNLFVPQELVRRVKHRAIDDQLSLSDWVASVLTERLDDGIANRAHKETIMNTDKGLKVMPIVHVRDMAKSIGFYLSLGGELESNSRDGDWAEIRFGGSAIGLLAHKAAEGEESVELSFLSEGPVSDIENRLSDMDVTIRRPSGDEAFGEQLQLTDPDGRTIKINRIDRKLIG